MKPTVTAPAQKGLLIALPLVVFAIVITILKLEANQALGIVPILLMLAGIVWACISYSNQMQGNVTFGNVFGHGFKASAVIAAIMGLWVAISLGLIFPESLDRAMDLQREAMQKKGDVPDEQIEQAMRIGKKMALPMGTIFSVIIYLIIGALGSLLGAAVAKKNPNPQPFDQIGN
jgi:hypothetical protein